MAGGTEINDITDLDELPEVSDGTMLGLILDVDLGCAIDDVLCSVALDFEGNPLAMAAAMAVQYRAGVYVAEKILSSTALNRDTLINRDTWETNRDRWGEKYNEFINYIVTQADYTANDCLSCKNIIEMTRQGLFS